MKCDLCGSPVSFMSQKRIKNGALCKECTKKIPKLLKVIEYDAESLKQILQYKECLSSFSETASYGKLRLDEMHGLLAISDKVTEDGSLIDSNDVFRCIDLEEFSLYCTDPHAQGNTVYCDIELSILMQNPYMKGKIKIKTNVKCSSRVKDSSRLEWSEPAELSMFRNMVNQMYVNEFEKWKKYRGNNFVTKAEIELFQAESLFMLEDGYSIEDVKKRRKLLMKAFHPDENNDTAFEAKKINESYQILVRKLGGT